MRGVRVLVADKAACYHALRAVHALWPPLADDARHKDYVRHPKANGYQSLHTVVVGPGGAPLEVQIRTRKMHLVAEFGLAAHWRYKEAVSADEAHERQASGGGGQRGVQRGGGGGGGRGGPPTGTALPPPPHLPPTSLPPPSHPPPSHAAHDHPPPPATPTPLCRSRGSAGC